MYALKSQFAQKNAEYENGIAQLFAAEKLPESLENFVKIIKNFNENNTLSFYPGSPKLATQFLRADDKLRLFELHPSDYEILQKNFPQQGRQTKIEMQDGFNGIKACLPPPTKRAVVLIDPPYELKTDYTRVVDCIKDSLKRFATGTYMIWYPLLQRPEPEDMVIALKKIGIEDWLNVSLAVQNKSIDGFGMHGSGVFIVNPPWTLSTQLEALMPTLTQLLGQDESASYQLNSQIK
jgi:23S rRNA (adenine2030-N6)-methyltransferase